MIEMLRQCIDNTSVGNTLAIVCSVSYANGYRVSSHTLGLTVRVLVIT